MIDILMFIGLGIGFGLAILHLLAGVFSSVLFWITGGDHYGKNLLKYTSLPISSFLEADPDDLSIFYLERVILSSIWVASGLLLGPVLIGIYLFPWVVPFVALAVGLAFVAKMAYKKNAD